MIGRVFIIMFFIGCFSLYSFLSYSNDNDQSVICIIDKGDSAEDISRKLAELSYPSTKYLLKIINKYKPLRHGEYEIKPKQKLSHVIHDITKGKLYKRKLIIPSGLTNKEIFKLINKHEKLIGNFNYVPEGMLFPDTYVYTFGESKQRLINHMHNTMLKVLRKEWKNRDKNLPYKSIYDALIIASVIEKEAMYHDDKRKVASVFINRIRSNQKLQSDPTVQYGIDLFNGYKTPLRRSHFLQSLPHSTYYVSGLPITAICNPSLSSIKAALHPDNTNYIYFISMPNNNKLIFSKTYQEHLNHVGELNRVRKLLSQ